MIDLPWWLAFFPGLLIGFWLGWHLYFPISMANEGRKCGEK